MTAFDAHKLLGQDVREFAGEGEPHVTKSVIVEIKGTQASLPDSYQQWRETPPTPDSIAQVDIEDDTSLVMDEVERELARLGLPRRPVRLDTAKAFVVTVTPSQLREISSWDQVGAIRPNRTYAAARPSSSRTAAGSGPVTMAARTGGAGRRNLPT